MALHCASQCIEIATSQGGVLSVLTLSLSQASSLLTPPYNCNGDVGDNLVILMLVNDDGALDTNLYDCNDFDAVRQFQKRQKGC